jgi:predicted O-methyltransferase YrrM
MGLPGKIRRSYARGGWRGVWHDTVSSLEVRPTRFPLEARLRQAIERSLERASPPPPGPATLPSFEDLQALWPVLLFQMRLLHGANPGDPYFDPRHHQDWREAGREVEKSLFEIWLYLRAPGPRILEIGTRTGLSLISKLAFVPREVRTTVFCLDLFVEQGSPQAVRRNLRRLRLSDEDVFFLVGDSKHTLPALVSELPALRFDHVLVDGSHEPADAFADLSHAFPLVESGGFLVFDDAGPTGAGVAGHDLLEVWEKALAPHADEFETRHYDRPHGFCVARRK